MPLFGSLGNNTTPLYGGGQVRNPANVIYVSGAPSSNAVGNAVGTVAVDRSTGIAYMAVKNTGLSGSVTWAILGGATAAIATINSNAPIAGNYVLAGTVGQITIAQTAGTSTFTIPSAFIAPGTVAATSGFVGSSGASAPSAGNIGQILETKVAQGSAVAVGVSGTAVNVGSVALTAGVWDVSGIVMMTGGAITGTIFTGSISATTATEGTIGDTMVMSTLMATAAADVGITIPQVRLTLAAGATYYLVGNVTYSGGSPTVYGRISATRVA